MLQRVLHLLFAAATLEFGYSVLTLRDALGLPVINYPQMVGLLLVVSTVLLLASRSIGFGATLGRVDIVSQLQAPKEDQ